jgi:hypothetical protein
VKKKKSREWVKKKLCVSGKKWWKAKKSVVCVSMKEREKRVKGIKSERWKKRV